MAHVKLLAFLNPTDAFNHTAMAWYLVLTYFSLFICLSSCIYHFIRIIRLGKPEDFSKPSGDLKVAIIYSYTGAMSPTKKESAYLHLPTYTAGIIYHLGTFLSIFLFVLILFNIAFPEIIKWGISLFLFLSFLSGMGILLKRFFKKELKELSNPDDYISNILVTLFQLMTILFLFNNTLFYYITTSLLLLYLPVGKLKHTIYFFAARYHLALFFGLRNVWPPKKIK